MHVHANATESFTALHSTTAVADLTNVYGKIDRGECLEEDKFSSGAACVS